MFDKITVLTFAKNNFVESQQKLQQQLTSIGIKNQKHLTDTDLPIDFLNKYSEILSHKKGYGYCLWKPYIISQEIHKIDDDNILIYMDSTDQPEKSFFESVLEIFKTSDYFFLNRGFNHGQWTKRDCFVLMNSDNSEYHNHVQIEAGVVGFNPTEFNKQLINDWFEYSTNKNILTEVPNICGLPNLENYREHRYDQSILTNLFIKNKLTSYRFGNDKIKYNYNQPKNY